MIKKILLILTAIMSVTTLAVFSYRSGMEHNPQPMTIFDKDIYKHLCAGGFPIEQRTPDVFKWLSSGVEVKVSSGSGSGTIVYFNPIDGYAYVQSCGHLWNGNMTAIEGERRNVTCSLITWYHNEKKLSQPKSYIAHVLYYSNVAGQDCSLLRFKPDWAPHYRPLAPANFEYKIGNYYHSVGCDGGREIAHYNVRYIGMQGGGFGNVTTTENSPRPGRSGGGLLTEDYYVGICVMTTNVSGRGNGLFTSIQSVRNCNTKNGYDWLNKIDILWARKIPIIDHNNPQGNYPENYIPLPQGHQP